MKRYKPNPTFNPSEYHRNQLAILATLKEGSRAYKRQENVCKFSDPGRVRCEHCAESFYADELQYNRADELVCINCQDSLIENIADVLRQ